jgi:hypothetical protein
MNASINMKTNQTNEQRITRAEVKTALEILTTACKNNNAAFCGFAWGVDPPILIRFGNVKEQGPKFAEMLIKLYDVTEDRVEKGLAVNDPLRG